MRKLLLALAAVGVIGTSACWVPVQISAPSDNTVYVLDWKVPSSFSPEGRVMRCTGTVCQKIYQPK
jgi:hypothetical protein